MFHLATMGGAEVLGLDSVIGNFELGKQVRQPRCAWFDASLAVSFLGGWGTFSMCNIDECPQSATGCQALSASRSFL